MSSPIRETQRTLQTTTGLVLGIGALLVATVSYVRITEVQGTRASLALVDLYFVGIGATGIVALISGFSHATQGQIAQLVLMYVTAVAAGVTGTPGDLTPLALFGLYLAHALVYLKSTPSTRRIILISGAGFLVGWGVGLARLATENVPGVAVTLFAGGVMAALLAILVHSVQTIQASQNEILEQRIAESTEELHTALSESNELVKHNRVLLREVHHRTKNNLQVVASLLSLRQNGGQRDDSGCRKVIDTARNHVYSMAKIHELFHSSPTSSSVYLSDFLEEVADLWHENSLVTAVKFDLASITHMAVSMDFAIPVGLALNELVANASEHGYPESSDKIIEVRADIINDHLRLAVSDRGVGFPDQISLERPQTTGLQIISALVQQLHGKLSVKVDHGTTFAITLPCTEISGNLEGCG